MKKFRFIAAALAVIVAVSANALSNKKAMVDEYFLDGDEMVLITTNGSCEVSQDPFCKYTLIPGQPDDGNPIHYQGVSGTQNGRWIP